jgi:ABC-2 type transport system permease protein
MRKINSIAKWEFLEKVKTKAFIISLIVTPIIIISFSIIPTLLSDRETESTKAIGIIDSSNVFFPEFINEIENYKLTNNQPAYVVINLTESNKSTSELISKADQKVLNSSLEGYLLVETFRNDSVKIQYRSMGFGKTKDLVNFEKVVSNILIRKNLMELGYSPENLEFLETNITIDKVKIDLKDNGSNQDFSMVFFSSFIFILLLMMMVIYSGQMLVRSLIEEKSNRIIEVLVSSCSPDELLTGKILGLSLLGLTQLFIWILIGLSLIGGAVVPPEIFTNIGLMLVYFILGFIFFSTLFVGIGSIVSTEQEAQLMTTYLSIILIFPIVFAVPAIENPDAFILKIFSFIPFTIPSVMLLRINIAQVSIIDIWITIVILLFSIVIMIRICSKIFRIGILSYGTKPSLKEIMNWIRSDS